MGAPAHGHPRAGQARLLYRDETGAETDRVIWPIAVAYFESVRLIVGWCELREGFRHFRTDRIVQADFLDTRYRTSRAKLRAAWKKERMEAARARSSHGRKEDRIMIEASCHCGAVRIEVPVAHRRR